LEGISLITGDAGIAAGAHVTTLERDETGGTGVIIIEEISWITGRTGIVTGTRITAGERI
jgi:hypothetical protein